MRDDGAVARYDAIGEGYARMRRPDPRIAARIHVALGDARTVVNVGAGTGSYEPFDRLVVAVEPSVVMAAQRPPDRPPAVIASAEALPLADDSADAVMAVLTMHHWSDRAAGVREMLRVARRRVVVVTIDMDVAGRLWLFDEYAPEIAERDRAEFPDVEALAAELGAQVEVLAVPRDCADRFLLAYWNDPEGLLEPGARAATSGFARLGPDREGEVVERLRRDLASGAWDARHGHLRALEAHDAGLRLLVAALG